MLCHRVIRPGILGYRSVISKSPGLILIEDDDNTLPRTSGTDYPLTQRHIPEKKQNPQLHRCDKLKTLQKGSVLQPLGNYSMTKLVGTGEYPPSMQG